MGELEGGFSQLQRSLLKWFSLLNSLSNPLLISVPEEKEFLDPGNKITILGTELQLSSIRNELRFVKRSQKSRETVSNSVAEMQRPHWLNPERSQGHMTTTTKAEAWQKEQPPDRGKPDSSDPGTAEELRSALTQLRSQRTSARESIDLTPLDCGITCLRPPPAKCLKLPHCV